MQCAVFSVNCAVCSVPVSISIRLDAGEPGLQFQPEAGVVGPVGENEPAG